MASINSNFSAMTGARIFSEMSTAMNRAMEHLATGKRINRASDDVAGVIAASALKLDQSRLQSEIRGKEREMSRLGAFEGASSVVSDLLTELQGLVTTAASSGGASSAEREAMDMQATSILKTIDRLATTTTFEGQDILQGMATVKIGNHGEFTLSDLRGGGSLNLVDGDLEEAQRVLSAATDDVNTARAGVGNRTKSLEHEVQIDLKQLEAQEGARSLIEDADIAKETSALIRAQVLRQAANFAMSMFAKSESETILHLLG